MSILHRIQSTLNAPKDKYNSFGKYSYRSCESILEALKPLLNETNSTVTISDDIVEVGGRVYVEATAVLKGPDEEHSVTAFAREAESKKGMDEAQITGAASSYARKYALNGLFAIDDTKDADATNDHETKREQGSKPSSQASDKPWYNSFNDDRDRMIDDINAGRMTGIAIINRLSANYIINKKIKDAILALDENRGQ